MVFSILKPASAFWFVMLPFASMLSPVSIRHSKAPICRVSFTVLPMQNFIAQLSSKKAAPTASSVSGSPDDGYVHVAAGPV